MGPFDQRSVELQNQVLVYSGEVLGQDLGIAGPVEAVLFASSTAVDTDFCVKLVDVQPDGKAINIVEGILRTKYRNGTSQPELIEPDQVYELNIPLGNTSYVFKTGHRIRVEIASSNFPQWDRNTNSGNTPAKDSFLDMVVATQSICHDSQRPSHIVLPVYSMA